MKTINKTELLISIFIPTLVLSVVYFVLGYFIKIPNLLLFCIIGTFTMFPIELGIILKASKKETGKYSLASAFVGYEKMTLWKIFVIAFVFFGIAGGAFRNGCTPRKLPLFRIKRRSFESFADRF